MDPVAEIKARLPIEDLVGQYCQLQKKGRNLVCICPFHKDSHPSFTVSPDKGIAYCFACNNGGDIFSFYQKIENVDFRQALKDLADKTGVKLPDLPQESAVKKDEKDRLRECLDEARKYYQQQLKQNEAAQKYLQKRGISAEEIIKFGIGVAPDSFSATYEHLLKQGFSRSEILKAGLAIQKDLSEGRMYDRFRNRIMFPIHDHQGKIVAFGGRTLGEDDAKYINSSEGPLYRKSAVLYGYHYAKDAIRDQKKVVMVEGYFDVVACHRVGVENVVAVSGTALTEEHVQLIKRSAETVVLCLDQDTAGQAAAERAFTLCSPQGVHVHAVVLEQKDPDEAAAADANAFKEQMVNGGKPYLDTVIDQLQNQDITSVEGKRAVLKRMAPLLQLVNTAVEKEHYLERIAGLLGTTKTVLEEDVDRVEKAPVLRTSVPVGDESASTQSRHHFSDAEITLALFCMYPIHLRLLDMLIAPEDGMAAVLYDALKALDAVPDMVMPETLGLEEEYSERLSILLLFCEQNNFTDWSENISAQEIRRNCQAVNRRYLQQKQRDIAKQLLRARAEGDTVSEAELSTQYQQVLQLAKLAK